MAQIALAWSLAFPGVTAPIVGTTSLTNLKELIGACTLPASFMIPICSTPALCHSDAVHIKLKEEEIKYLEEPYIPQSIVGHT